MSQLLVFVVTQAEITLVPGIHETMHHPHETMPIETMVIPVHVMNTPQGDTGTYYCIFLPCHFVFAVLSLIGTKS